MGSRGSTGRDLARSRRRVPCDVLAAGRVYKGFATRLAPHEMFIGMAGSSLPRRGADVLILLRHDGGGEPVEIDAVVTRQQLTEVTERGIDRGIELRIHGAPPEYHSMFVDPALCEDTTEVELLIELDLVDPDLPAQRDLNGPMVCADPDRDAPAFRDDPAVDRDFPAPREGLVELPGERIAHRHDTDLPQSRIIDPAPGPAQEPDASERPLEYDAESRTTRAATPAHPQRPANAIVVYDGDRLTDIYDMLEKLGARPERARLSGPTRFRGWSLPPRLLVVDAQDALSLDWPKSLIADGVVRVAVATSASAVIGKILRGHGFHYLIRRPVHPRALELLFRLALHRGPERRKSLRSTLGIDARLATSPWRWAESCTLLELSPMGCRVVTRQDIPLLSHITLRTSRAATGSRPISLGARVVRRVRDEAAGEWALALRFIDVPAAQQGRLDDLLARTAVGPTSTLVESPPERLRLWLRGLFASRSERSSAEFGQLGPSVAGPQSEKPEPAPERRRGARGSLDAEVVALDEGLSRVTAVLMGRDLSLLGMRVDPHPEFVIGRRMRVAFFDSISRGTLEISAEVVRDDGDRGMGIRFVGMDAQTAARLGELVAALPVVESLNPRTRSLMLARIRSDVPVADPGPAPVRFEPAPAVARFEQPLAPPTDPPEPETSAPLPDPRPTPAIAIEPTPSLVEDASALVGSGGEHRVATVETVAETPEDAAEQSRRARRDRRRRRRKR